MAQVIERETATRPAAESAVKFVPSGRRIRVMFGGQTIADSQRAWTAVGRGLPVYYFPLSDVRREFLKPTALTKAIEGLGEASYSSIKVGDKSVEKGAWTFANPAQPRLQDHVAFVWDAMDQWFEEDDEVFAHARSPFHRVDVLHSSRNIRVVIDGVTVAESDQPRILIETSLPNRYYLPKIDVRLDLLTPTSTHTLCPYKGKASYWSVSVNGKEYKDIVWAYPAPLPECPKIENLLCFYNEKVDLYVDGELQAKPKSPWS